MSDGVLDRVEVTLVDSVDAALSLKRWLGERHGDEDVVGIDTEATGLSPEVDRVRLVQFGDRERGWAVPFERWGGVAEEVIRLYEGTWVAFNAPYDRAMLAAEGIELPRHRVRDPMFMAHVLDSRCSLALKRLCDQHIDTRASAAQRLLDEAMSKNKWTWATVPVTFRPYWSYGALDPVITRHLHDLMWPRVRAEAPLSYDLEVATAWVTERMSRYGSVVDREYVTDLAARLREYCRQVEEWCRLHYGVWPGSNAQVVRRLQADGIGFTKQTRGGAVCLDKEVLGQLDHPLAQAVLNRRQADKTAGTYLEPFLRFSERDGLLHPSINPVGGREKTPGESAGTLGVRTGRMSMSDPNLQNVPVRTVMGDKIRRAIRARDGHALLMCDFDQMEMRLFAHLSRDEGMLRAFRDPGTDFFVALARDIFEEPSFRKTDSRRQWVKNGGYTKIYGGGIAKLAKTIGISEDVAGAFMRRFDQLYPGGKRFVDDLNAEVYRLQRDGDVGYVRSRFTNRRLNVDRGREYACVNYLIQNMAAEVLKMKLVQLDQAGVGDWLTLPVHDEVIADVPLEHADEAERTFGKVMNDDSLLEIPVTATLQRAEWWGAKK